MSSTRATVAVTVDVEDWPQSSWDRSLPLSEYCADNVQRVLDILAEFPGARATFFILGKFAEKHPIVVRGIADAGHEIASHGTGHVELFRLGPKKFAEDLRRSTEIIAQTAGRRPEGYRAPDFSIVGESLWALDILAEQGYKYDTSIFPIRKARYGIENWPRNACRVKLPCGSTILELPIAALEMMGRRIPVGGGGYARLMPGPVLIKALQSAAAQLNFPPVYYCHPYEFDPDEFKKIEIRIPRKVRFHQGLGRKRSVGKLRRILRTFECVALDDAIDRCDNLPEIDYAPFQLDPDQVVRPPIFAETRSDQERDA